MEELIQSSVGLKYITHIKSTTSILDNITFFIRLTNCLVYIFFFQIDETS
jgi:hypothetical protein